MARSEYDWIERIQAVFAAAGAWRGEQAWADAVTLPDAAAGGRVAASVDCGLAGRHFPWPSNHPHGCGYRVYAAAVSDLAAIGAEPLGALVSAVLPRPEADGGDPAALDELIAGMAACAVATGCPLLGGNVSAGPLAMHSTVFGAVSAAGGATRGPLVPGDTLWLTGTHGDAMAGLARIRAGAGSEDGLAARYWRPSPRLAWGRVLAARPEVVGLIDVSDGWLRDLVNLGRTGEVGLALDPGAVPRSDAWMAAHGERPDPAAYWGGDDYELAFATRGVQSDAVAAMLCANGISAAPVGYAKEGPGVVWQRPPALDPPPGFGYDPYL